MTRRLEVDEEAAEEAEAQLRDTVHVLAFEALQKRPGYWRSRLRVR